jgi:hypothetical protein
MGIERVGLLKSPHHTFDSRRTIDDQWSRAATQPTLHNDLTEFAYVIGMKVGQKHRV